MCLHGNSCISSFMTKFSLQIAHSASCPILARISSDRVMTGSFATTSLLAGGALGATGMLSKIYRHKFTSKILHRSSKDTSLSKLNRLNTTKCQPQSNIHEAANEQTPSEWS